MKKFIILFLVIFFTGAIYSSVLLTSEPVSQDTERSMPSAYSELNKSLQRSRTPISLITFDNIENKRVDEQNTLLTAVNAPRKEPSRIVTDGIPSFYGLLESSKSSSSAIGMYNVGIDGSGELLWARPKTDKSFINNEAETFRTGFYRNGDVYIFERSENGVYGHEAYSSEMFVYDLSTGELKQKTDLSIADAKMQMFLSMAYDPAGDMVYAYTISYDIDTPYYLVKFKPDSPQEITIIDTKNLMSTVLALTWHDGNLYGIQYQGYTFVKVDPKTGQQNAISKPFAAAPRFSWSGFGMTWMDSLDGFVLNHIYSNGSSSLDLLKLDGSLEKLVDLPVSEQFAFLFTAGEVSDSAETPSKPLITGNTFEGSSSREGTFTLKMPTTYADGRTISSTTPITLTAVAGTIAGTPDKVTYSPGETAVVSFNLPSDGRYSFEFKVSIADGFASSAQMMYVGYDVPVRPGNVRLAPGKLSWDAVTSGVNKGYFVPSDVNYDVVIDGATVATGISATEWTVNFTNEDLKRHTASVVANHHGHASETAPSNDLVDGRPMTLDVVLVPTEEQSRIFTIIDGNSDGSTWEFASDGDPAETYFKYRLNSYRKADDWLVSPPVSIPDASKLYSFMIEANRVSGYPELFEVKMGNNPDPTTWTTVLIPETEVPVNAVGTVYQPYTVDFNVQSAGTYYFAVHCTSAADMHTLKVRSIKILDTSRSTEGPDSPTGISVVPASDGSLKADVSMILPEQTISGDRINPLETLTVSVSTPAGEANGQGHPGEEITVSAVPAIAGFNDFSILVSQGHLEGKSIKIQQYVGPDVPGRPENMKYEIDQTNHHVTLRWDPPTKGAHGGYVDPETLTYDLCYLVQDDGQMYWQIIEKLGSATSVGVSYDESDPFIEDLGVVASGTVGMGTEVAQAHFAVGRPWILPMREKFVNTYAEYYPFMIMGDTEEYLNSNWGFVDPSKAGDRYANATGMALVGEGYEAGAKGMFGFPKFTTSKLDRVSIAFDIYLGSITPEVDVYAEGPLGMEREKIGTLTADRSAEAWKRVELSLPAKFCKLGWVQIILDAHFATDEQKVLIDSYSFKPDVDYDLGVVSISGPNTPEISRENHYTAVVDNIGTRADAMPTGIWRVISGGTEIASAIVPANHDIIEPDGVCAYRFSFTPTADHIGPAEVRFEIGLADENLSNNATVKSINIAQGSAVAVTDLTATCVDGSVNLEWSEPKLDDGVESFEDCEPFLLNDDAAWLGNFKNIDLDGQITYGTSGWTNPNSGLPGAFSVWDLNRIDAMLAEAGFKEHTYSASDGRRLAIAFSTGGGYVTDDWLISPMIVGGSDVSFKLRAISTSYPETVEVLYSTTGDSPSDFEGKRISRYTTRDDYAMGDNIEYETVSLTLPQDARYFAIRYVSRDMFAVMIDDIHYSPAQSVEGVTGYDIIRDSRTIAANVKGDDCKFVDSKVENRHTYAYQVVPLLGKSGKGAPSNTAWTGVTGIENVADAANATVVVNGHHIIASGFEGKTISIATVDGRTVTVRRDATRSESFSVAPGVYVLRAGNSSYKLIVK